MSAQGCRAHGRGRVWPPLAAAHARRPPPFPGDAGTIAARSAEAGASTPWYVTLVRARRRHQRRQLRQKLQRLEHDPVRGLSDEEAALVEMKLALADHLRRRRLARHVSQVELAGQLGSSQSRVAKMEAADGSVSLDLLVRALLVLGETPRAVARVLGRHAA